MLYRALAVIPLLVICGMILPASPMAEARNPSTAQLGALLLRPHDLGPGYGELNPGTSRQSGILESYGFVPVEGNRPGTGIVFRRGAYLVEINLYHTPTQPARLVRLARLVDTRMQQGG